MTYKQKLRRDHPEFVNVNYCGGCYGCPAEYYPEAKPFEYCTCGDEATCAECWNREADSTDDAPQEKPKTNGDRIRAMDETKFVRFLDAVTWSALDSGGDLSKCKYPTDTLGWREWLKQPAEEGSE